MSEFQKIRLSRSPFSVLVMKVASQTSRVEVESINEFHSIEDLAEGLPHGAPRFIVLSYKLERSDGRVQYPLAFVYFSPMGGNPSLNMLYTRAKNPLSHALETSHVIDITDKEDMTAEFFDAFFSKR